MLLHSVYLELYYGSDNLVVDDLSNLTDEQLEQFMRSIERDVLQNAKIRACLAQEIIDWKVYKDELARRRHVPEPEDIPTGIRYDD
jgi:hypothetical protein